MANVAIDSTSCLNTIQNKIWGSDCFGGSKKKERTTIITFIVLFILTFLFAITTRSSGLGTVSAFLGIIGGFLWVRRVYKNREDLRIPEDKRFTMNEFKQVLFNPQDGKPITAPALFKGILDKFPFEETSEFVTFDAPSESTKKSAMMALSPLVKKVPNMTHGKFRGGQEFILIKFVQKHPQYPDWNAPNFLLFTGPKEGHWAAYDSESIPQEWDLLFDFRKDDLDKLERILVTRSGSLRRPGSQPDWLIELPSQE